ncbi:MAG: AAA family ATPase [Magnetococcales bacterium]|nr:AAA family ATPase [Magnetococcales bacterium]
MKYLRHFGLRENPFAVTPDPAFLFRHERFQETADRVVAALTRGEGIVTVTGPAGTGKTLLCRYLLGRLEQRFKVAYLLNPMLSVPELNRTIADELGVPPGTGHGSLLHRMVNHLLGREAEGRKAVILVDDAQSLPDKTLEALRLMTNLETDKDKIVQLVLVGQPELAPRLAASPSMEQRITTSLGVTSLERRELGTYVEHRLKVAGNRRGALLTRWALRALFKASGGTPRLVNLLTQKALEAAAEGRVSRIGWRHVRAAVKEMAQKHPTGRSMAESWLRSPRSEKKGAGARETSAGGPAAQ